MTLTPKFRRLDPAQRREILDAAGALLAERAYDRGLCRGHRGRAGVTRRVVHHYFGGRNDVYIGLLEALGAEREEQLRPPAGRSARARVADTVARWLDWTQANRTIWRMSPAPRRVSSVTGGRDVEADGCGHDEDGGAEFCD